MTRFKSPNLSVLLIETRPMRSARYRRAIEASPQLSLTGAARDLTEAYNLTEHQHPDLVIMAEEIAHRDNFPMYAEMLGMLEIEGLVIAAETSEGMSASTMPRPIFGTRRCLRSGFPRVSEQKVEEGGGLEAYLRERTRLSKTVPTPTQITGHGAPLTPPPMQGGLTARAAPRAPQTAKPEDWKTVVIGASTGGVEALIELLSAFPEACPPTLIVQHINGNFLPGLAQRLDRHCAAHVRPAQSTETLTSGTILMAPGNAEHLTLASQGRRSRLTPGDPVSGHRPSVDALFHSAVVMGEAAVGVLLTGMGRDGAAGLLAMHNAGATTFAQDRASCAVYGMPRAAMEIGAVSQQLPISRLAPAVLSAAARAPARVRHA